MAVRMRLSVLVSYSANMIKPLFNDIHILSLSLSLSLSHTILMYVCLLSKTGATTLNCLPTVIIFVFVVYMFICTVWIGFCFWAVDFGNTIFTNSLRYKTAGRFGFYWICGLFILILNEMLMTICQLIKINFLIDMHTCHMQKTLKKKILKFSLGECKWFGFLVSNC